MLLTSLPTIPATLLMPNITTLLIPTVSISSLILFIVAVVLRDLQHLGNLLVVTSNCEQSRCLDDRPTDQGVVFNHRLYNFST